MVKIGLKQKDKEDGIIVEVLLNSKVTRLVNKFGVCKEE